MLHLFLKGGPVMWPLLVASIVSLTVVIERIFFVLIQKSNETPELRKKMLFAVESGQFQRAAAMGEGSKDSIVNILTNGLKHRELLTTTLMASASDELKKYSRGISILDTIITLAPLLGLLGTVTGMIRAFGLLGVQELETPSVITGGIAEALIATAFGLGIAIFSLVPFNWLNAYVDNVRHQMEKAGSVLEVLVAKTTNKTSLEKEQESETKQLYETSPRVQTSRSN